MERLGMPDIPLKAREDAAPKPDPEALLALAAQWRLSPAHCAYIGDFRYDIEAAQRAGMLPVLYLGIEEAPSTHDPPCSRATRIPHPPRLAGRRSCPDLTAHSFPRVTDRRRA
jgi:FMN phosphatase YigB (HAD superfamily)